MKRIFYALITFFLFSACAEEESACISGLVYSTAGNVVEPLDKVTVTLYYVMDACSFPASCTLTETTQTDATGSFFFTDLGKGSYTLRLGESVSRKIELAAGAHEELQIVYNEK